jgi:hypothetical protein
MDDYTGRGAGYTPAQYAFSPRRAAPVGDSMAAPVSPYWSLLRRCGGAVRSVTTPTREVGLLTAEGVSDGRVEVVAPCCDLAVGDFEDTHDRYRYLDTVLTA